MGAVKSMFSKKDMGSATRVDRTKELMIDLEKAASSAVKEAAIMLKVIAREMVSRRYVKTTKQKQRDAGQRHWNAEQVAAERARGRAGFLARVDTGRRRQRQQEAFSKKWASRKA